MSDFQGFMKIVTLRASERSGDSSRRRGCDRLCSICGYRWVFEPCFFSAIPADTGGFLKFASWGLRSFVSLASNNSVAEDVAVYLECLVLALVASAGLHPATQYLRIQVGFLGWVLSLVFDLRF